MVEGILYLLICTMVGAFVLIFGVFAALSPGRFDGFFCRVLGNEYMLGATPPSRVRVWRTVGMAALTFDVVVLVVFVVLVFARLMMIPPA